ncbi:hypothetical protein GQ600_17087 [Phytophthora cactorum]|nr:hypothetical protein GQ600_17087 [Phytophthora cactorum]
MAIASENAVGCQATATNLERAAATPPESVEDRKAPKTKENRIKQRSTSKHQSEFEKLETAANVGRNDTINSYGLYRIYYGSNATAMHRLKPPTASECQGSTPPALAHTSVLLKPQSADSSAVAVRQTATADIARGNDSQPITTPSPAHSSRRITSGQSSSITALYVNTLVAFTPAKEGWVTSKNGEGLVSGEVGRLSVPVECGELDVEYGGNTNYSALYGQATGPEWGSVCPVDHGARVEIGVPEEELELCMEPYEPPTELPTTVADVEVIKNFRFDPLAAIDEPGDLYHHSDATATMQHRPEDESEASQCVVCRWEGRYAIEVTDYCVLHGVVHSATSEAFMCRHAAWTCLDKFHRYYLPRKRLFSKGKVRTSSALYKLKQGSSAAKSPAVRAHNVQE